MAGKTIADYEAKDGWDELNSLERCPHCETVYSPNGGYTGVVVDTNGKRYGSLYQTEPGTGPFFCTDCFEELQNNRKRQENMSLEDVA